LAALRCATAQRLYSPLYQTCPEAIFEIFSTSIHSEHSSDIGFALGRILLVIVRSIEKYPRPVKERVNIAHRNKPYCNFKKCFMKISENSYDALCLLTSTATR
jgi:hypothetical protein